MSPLSRPARIVSGILALVWILAGVAAVGLGLPRQRWGAVLLGAIAIVYGLLWYRMARRGRLLEPRNPSSN